MASSFSPNKNYELQVTGENDGTWGILLNGFISQVDLNMGGRQAVTIDSADVTLTTDQCENVFMYLTGTLTGNRDLIFPATAGGFFLVYNNTSGSFQVTAKPSGGTGVVVPQGYVTPIFINPTLTSALALATPRIMTTQGDIIYQGALAPARLGVGTSGQMLQTQGAAANPQWAWPSPASRAIFRANKIGSDQLITAGVGAVQITFTENVDIGSHFASSIWTPPSGYVRVGAELIVTGIITGSFNVNIAKNGVAVVTQNVTFNAASESRSVFIEYPDLANGTDTYQLTGQAISTNVNILGATTQSQFFGHMI